MPIYSDIPEDFYPRPSDINAPLRSTIGIGPRGPKGHSITAEVVDTDPYGYFRVQFKDAETGEVLVTTPNLDVGSRVFICDKNFIKSNNQTYTAKIEDFSTDQLGTIRDARVGDIVIYRSYDTNKYALVLEEFFGIGVVNRISTNGDITFTAHIETNVNKVVEGEIADGSITTEKLADSSVTKEKILKYITKFYHIVDTVDRTKDNSYMGTAQLIITDSTVILFDTGFNSDFLNQGSQEFCNDLETALDGRLIDVLILSHFHIDHIGNLEFIKNHMSDDCVYFRQMEPPSTMAATYEAFLPGYNAAFSVLGEGQVPQNNTPYIFGDTKITFFNTDSNYISNYAALDTLQPEYSYLNWFSLMASIETAGGIKILLTGDIQITAQELCKSYIPKDITIITTPHHGSDLFDSEGLFDQANAKYIVRSGRTLNSFKGTLGPSAGKPYIGRYSYYRQKNIYSNSNNTSCYMLFSNDKLIENTFSFHMTRGIEGGHCYNLAGTRTIDFLASGLNPSEASFHEIMPMLLGDTDSYIRGNFCVPEIGDYPWSIEIRDYINNVNSHVNNTSTINKLNISVQNDAILFTPEGSSLCGIALRPRLGTIPDLSTTPINRVLYPILGETLGLSAYIYETSWVDSSTFISFLKELFYVNTIHTIFIRFLNTDTGGFNGPIFIIPTRTGASKQTVALPTGNLVCTYQASDVNSFSCTLYNFNGTTTNLTPATYGIYNN